MPLFRSSNRHTWIGAEFTDRAAALVAVDFSGDKPLVKACDYIDCAEPERLMLFKQWVERNKLKGAKCNRVLHIRDYELLMMEAPSVPSDELAQAVRWRMKDMISYELEDVVIDIFELPADAYHARMKMLYAAVVNKAIVEDTKHLCIESKVQLKTIDVPELSIMNLITLTSVDQRSGFGVLHLSPDHSLINLCQNSNMYMTRQFGIEVSEFPVEEQTVTNLGLELQRSLDYFESQIGKKGVNNIVLFPLDDPTSEVGLIKSLEEQMHVKIQRVDVRTIVDLEEHIDIGQLNHCISALSVALRYSAMKKEGNDAEN